MSNEGSERAAPGQVHGAVYWNVFGERAEVNKVIGEGFAYRNGEFQWNSFLNRSNDAYHDSVREISILGRICVESILKDWKETSEIGKTFSVARLLC